MRSAIRPNTGWCAWAVTAKAIIGGYRWKIRGGVDEADLDRIFAPFSRLDGSRPGDGGFGLGLSIARSAIQRQGGTLWAENGKQGLRLCMRLPAHVASDREAGPRVQVWTGTSL